MWTRDEKLFADLSEKRDEPLAVVLRAIVGRFYGRSSLPCPMDGDSFHPFPKPATGVALVACEGCGFGLSREQARAVSDYCSREHKFAVARWLGARQACLNAGWKCGRIEAAELLDRMGSLPLMGFAKGAAYGAGTASTGTGDGVGGFMVGTVLGMALGKGMR